MLKGPEALDEFRLVIISSISAAEAGNSMKLFACEATSPEFTSTIYSCLVVEQLEAALSLVSAVKSSCCVKQDMRSIDPSKVNILDALATSLQRNSSAQAKFLSLQCPHCHLKVQRPQNL